MKLSDLTPYCNQLIKYISKSSIPEELRLPVLSVTLGIMTRHLDACLDVEQAKVANAYQHMDDEIEKE
jgi:hypothetical protein